MIHADCDIIPGASLVVEHGIGGQGADRVDALGAQKLYGGMNDVFVLASHRSVFAGMRIETGDGKARPFDAEAVREIGMCDTALSLRSIHRSKPAARP